MLTKKTPQKSVKLSKTDDLLNTLTNDIRKTTLQNDISDAVLYLRSSSIGQNNDDNNQHSLITQKALCTSYAKRNNLNIIEIIEEVRRANDIKKLKINKIPEQYSNINLLIADPSRMARDFVEGADFIRKCARSNIVIHSVRDNSISNTSLGKRKIVDSIMVANDESETVSKRIRTMNQLKKKYGSKFGRVPYGYSLVKENIIEDGNSFPINKHVENKKEQRIIKLIGWLRYGCEINTFYRLFRKIIRDPTKKLYYEGKEWTNIQFEECDIDYIAFVLNSNNILKRGEQWTKSSVLSILNKIPKEDKKPFMETDNEEYSENESEDEHEYEHEHELNNNDFNEEFDVSQNSMSLLHKNINNNIQPIINKSNEMEQNDNDFERFLQDDNGSSSSFVELQNKSKINEDDNDSLSLSKKKSKKNIKIKKLKIIINSMLSFMENDSDSE